MTAYEMMLSESQERMLIVAASGREREIVEIFKKWELDAVVIGAVTADGRLRVKKEGRVFADIPITALTDQAPVYARPVAELQPSASRAVAQMESSAEEIDATFMRLIASPALASKEWVYRQYDHTVRTNTVTMPGSDSAVVRIKETRRALAMTLDSNARYSHIDPRGGARLIIAEACRNLIVSGARPVALTNCLNFASPERVEVMLEFSETIDGMREACEAFQTPVTGGNVSFYNETEGRGVYPTPVIGMVGIVEDLRHITTQWFKNEDRAVLLLGANGDDLGASQYLLSHGKMEGRVPRLDLEFEKRVQEACLRMIREGAVESAHDVSDGGLAIALAECAFSSYRRKAVGVKIDLESDLSLAALLFGETPSRIILSVADSSLDRSLAIAREAGAPAAVIGRTGGERIEIIVNRQTIINRQIDEVEAEWRDALPRIFEIPSVSAD
jgi:phosphoribosylformylglycinamidine synthase